MEHGACEVLAAARDVLALVREGEIKDSGRLALALRALAHDLAVLTPPAPVPPAPPKSTRGRRARLQLVR
jgi:hypothetical protein